MILRASYFWNRIPRKISRPRSLPERIQFQKYEARRIIPVISLDLRVSAEDIDRAGHVQRNGMRFDRVWKGALPHDSARAFDACHKRKITVDHLTSRPGRA